VTLKLTQDNGQPFDTDIFALDQSDRTFTIDSVNTDLNKLSIAMILEIDNTVQTISDSFSVTFQDGCSGAELTGSQFLEDEVDLFLYSRADYFFTKPELDSPLADQCTFNYKLLDAATGSELDPLIFSFDFSGVYPKVGGTVPS
jgi:hypothetical protein